MYSARNDELFNEISMAQKIIKSFMLDIYQQFQVEFFYVQLQGEEKILSPRPPPFNQKLQKLEQAHNMAPSKKFPFPSCESI